MISIEQLQVKYGELIALDIREPIRISRGDRIGIIGSNGAGKTTFVKAMLGLVKYSGKVKTELSYSDMAAHMQDNNYVKTVPVRFIIQAILNTKIKDNQRLRELIDFFDFSSCLNKKYQNLSGGQKQRLTIIIVLMQDADITFYDEVTSGLDFETRQKLMSKLEEWYQQNDNSLCIISHYYDELNKLTDKLMILERGCIVAYGKTAELFEKYCGRVVIAIDNNEKNQTLTKEIPKIPAPEHLLAFSCNSTADEIRIVTEFSEQNINYKRCSNDIELLFANAVGQVREEDVV